VIKSEAPIAVDRVETPPGSGPDFESDPDGYATGSETSPGNGALLSLMKQLRDELNAFLADVEAGREFSGNRDSSHGL
jgi:hypothetical protein